MKKIITLFSLVVVSTVVNAQLDGVQFGAKAGVNFANLTASGGGISVSGSSLTSFTAGGFAIVPIGETFAIQPELAYSGLGAKFGGDKTNLNYLTVPVFAKYVLSNGIGIYAGPQISYLLSAKSGGQDIKSEVKSTDFSAAFGADFTLKSGFNVAARYQLGLSNVSKDPDGTLKNKAFTITLGYVFGSK